MSQTWDRLQNRARLRGSVSYSWDLPMNYLKRSNFGALGLGAALVAACSATGGVQNTNLDPDGNSGSGGKNIGVGGSSGNSGKGSGGSGAIVGVGNTGGTIMPPVGDGVVPDDDPANPAITHPTCGVGHIRVPH